jgi:mannose-6-phosphate isomerase-like protein (cupin superfamily)
MPHKSAPKPFVLDLPADNEYLPLLQPGKSSVRMHSGCVSLKPGESVGEHSTENYEELIVVIAGSGELESEGFTERRQISAGQVAYNPPHSRHNVHNTGDTVLKYVYIVAPAE